VDPGDTVALEEDANEIGNGRLFGNQTTSAYIPA